MTTTAEQIYYAIIPSTEGPAFGVGLTIAEAIADAKKWQFEDANEDHAYEITEESYCKILDGDPDAYEVI